MFNENELKKIISQVLDEMKAGDSKEVASQVMNTMACNIENVSDNELVDITATSISDEMFIPNPINRDEYMKLKAKTPARIGIHRAGPRYKTRTFLRFRADHAVAMDAVFKDVPESFVEELGMFGVQTKCTNKDEYLTRPDLGRMIDDAGVEMIKSKCKMNPKVQIYISDGLSSTAIEANVKNTLPALMQGLKAENIEVGTPFFVKYGRVGAMDHISQIVNAEVTVVLIGERPGLATGESMSCYMVYKGFPGIEESKRTVISNIHKNGTPAAEAGAHIAGVVKRILSEKASGVDMKL